MHFLLDLLFPPCCLVCDEPLSKGEQYICTRCLMNMPLTPYKTNTPNDPEQRFIGKVAFEKAASYFHYSKGSPYDKILFALKYQGQKDVGRIIGRQAAQSLLNEDFFDNIDVMVPIPLHPKRYRQRGYNQSEWIAHGIAELTGLPINTTSVVRSRYNATQTQKNRWSRWDNSADLFNVIDPEPLKNKHILLVDDVLTTGATLTTCAKEILKTEGTRISFFTVANA